MGAYDKFTDFLYDMWYRGSASVHAGIPPPRNRHPPLEETPPWTTPPPGPHPPLDQALPDQTPPDQAPPRPGTPLDQAPPPDQTPPIRHPPNSRHTLRQMATVVDGCPKCPSDLQCPFGELYDDDGCPMCECINPVCEGPSDVPLPGFSCRIHPCPLGYQCTAHPTDLYAVCCPKVCPPTCPDHMYCDDLTYGECVCEDGYHICPYNNICVKDCPDHCPQNSDCDDYTDGVCECLPGFHYDSNEDSCCAPCNHPCGPHGTCDCEGDCRCEDGYHVTSLTYDCVPDCPDPCPQNRHCDDTTNGLCECIPGHESDPNDPTGACCPECPLHCDLDLHSYCECGVCKCVVGYHHDSNGDCVKDCPICAEIHCPNGKVIDIDGCWTCECEPPGCPICGDHSYCNVNTDGQCVCYDEFHHDAHSNCVPDCPDPCPLNSHCNDNTDGVCECLPGFKYDNGDCCLPCGHSCGNYGHCGCEGICDCDMGYHVSANSQECVPVCSQCGNNSYCNESTDGKCECDIGHYQHQETNECVKQCPLLCGDYSHCDHTTDGQCVCDEGYSHDVLLGCVKDCPFCPAIHCPHGQITDVDGCWTCECDCLFCGLHSQCDKSTGQCVCDHGYHHDENLDCVKDCPSCDDHSHCDDTTDGQCVCDESYSFDLNQKCVKDCPFCPTIHCPHGQIMDVDGCWTCECDCLFCGLHSQCDKSTGQCVCDHEYHHDSNLDCVKDCPSCDDHSHCDDTTDGKCVCDEGYSFDLNQKCVKECPVCAQIHCDYGKLYDADGCWTCDCEPPPVHPCYDDSECHEFGHCDGMWCKCNEGYAGDGKDVCEEDCTCRIRGDPIWDMFDGQYCVMPAADPDKRHTLTKYRMNVIDKCSFMVEVGTSHPLVDGRTLWGVTEPRVIQVWFDGIIYRFEQDSRVTINGQEIALPHTCAQNKCKIVKTENFVVLESPDCGIQVGFEGAGLSSVATIRVPGAFGEELVGMCGNCDGRMNDMKTLDGTNVDDENDRCEKISESYVADDSYDDGFGINLEHILQ